MKLLYTVNSPYARKVRIVALEKHVDIELQTVVLSDPDCPVKQYNPLGKVPVLILDDNEAVYDSRVIVEYLDNRTPVSHLIPTDNSARTAVRRWEALADGVCDAAVAMMLEQRKDKAKQDEAVLLKQLDKVTRGLAKLDADLNKKKWCVNDTFSLADIALGSVLGYLELRFSDLKLLEKHENLAKINAQLLKRESFKNTLPDASK